MTTSTYDETKNNYAKLFSELFSSRSIIVLSILCLLNNLSLDLYSALCFLKVVAPGGVSFWIIGYILGKKLDTLDKKGSIEQLSGDSDFAAYEIPGMFSNNTIQSTIQTNAEEI